MVEMADLLLSLNWESATPRGTVRHRDCLFAHAVDLAKGILPEPLKAGLSSAAPGQTMAVAVSGADLTGPRPGGIVEIAREGFRGRRPDGAAVTPKRGRFYPAAFFDSDAIDTPFVRCVGIGKGAILLDAGHPLAPHKVSLEAQVMGKLGDSAEPGRPAADWIAELVAGPGMQACWRGEATDFLDADSYARPDEAADPQFYAPPRITAHLDSRAQQTVGAFYRKIIPPEGRVLDLMSSAHSNLARDQRYAALYGLGLNGPEMYANGRLDGAVIGDLNTYAIPFADGSFDAAICTVSIDYLTDPIRTLGEVARVLRPGAPFAVTFSNRWFPPKVTRLWTELHPFEQIGLIVDYFEQAGGFRDIETASFRGYPRPMDDPYYRQTTVSDPIFAVVGRAVD